MKYDAQLGEFKNKLAESKRILIALPANVNNDKMAGALALYLSLKQSGKDVAVVSEAEIRVSQSVLFGIGDVKTDLPEISSGNFILGLDGVVVDGKVPALVDLDWYPEGTTLNLVFNVVPGEKFEPINISHHYDNANFDLIITIGVPTLAQLGNVYNNNLEKFTDTPKIDIDNSNNNTLFGAVNIIDPGVPVSEIVMHILQGMSLPQDPDIATNIITGVYDSTRGLTSNVTAETFLAIGEAMQMGGKIVRTVGNQPQSSQSNPQGLDIRQQSGGQQNRDSRPQQPRNDGNRPNRSNDNRGRVERPDNRNQTNQSISAKPVGQVEEKQSSTSDEDKQSLTPNENKGTLTSDEDKPVGEILQPFKENLEPVVQRESVPVEPVSSQVQPESTEIPLSEVTDVSVNDVDNAGVTVTKLEPEQAPSQFEAPNGEQAMSSSAESGTPPPDWLTPKLFGAKGLG